MAELQRRKPLTPDEVAERTFTMSRRGFEQDEVETFLAEVADELKATRDRERALLQQLAEAERAVERERTSRPVLDEEALTAALGAEAGSILRAAHEAAACIKAKAEQDAAQLIQQGRDQGAVIRREAEGVLAKREAEAKVVADQLIEQAKSKALQAKVEIEIEAAELAKGNHVEAKALVADAMETRERILGDLARRKRVAQAQIEELRTGRERLLEAYRVVRETLDQVTEQLQRADAEARAASPAPKRRRPGEREELPPRPAMAISETGRVTRPVSRARDRDGDRTEDRARVDDAEPAPA